MQRSPLLQLPGDIRNIIWDFVFHQADDVHVDFSMDQARRTDSASIFALSMTCRELYNETRDLPFWLNTVHFHVPVVQDLSVVRSHRYQNSAPALPPARRRVVEVPYNGNLASKDVALRQKAQEYITLAMRLPQVDHITTRLWEVLSRPAVLRRLRRVHVHLGFQTNNIFVERFYTAWAEVLPYLRLLRDHTELRVSFQLRLSRRLVVHYDFKVDSEAMLQEMDQCVLVDGELSLPEIASINAVRSRVWHGLFEDGVMKAYSRRVSVSLAGGCISRTQARMVVGGGGVSLLVS